MPDQAKLDQLWKRVEDARLQWKFAHQYANEVSADRPAGGIPSADGSYLSALRGRRLAAQNYRRALQEFNTALRLENPPQKEPRVATQKGTVRLTPAPLRYASSRLDSVDPRGNVIERTLPGGKTIPAASLQAESMPLKPHKLDLLWKRLEDAKLQHDFALTYTKEIKADKLSGDIPAPDGHYAHRNALRGELEAVERLLTALQDFKAALAAERRPLGVKEPADNGLAAITRREREVLKLIASGKSSKQIAAELGIAFRTAVCHRYRIQTKLNVHNIADLTRAALRVGLIEL